MYIYFAALIYLPPPAGASLLINEFDLTACLELNLLFLFRFFSVVASGDIRVARPPSHPKSGCKGDVCLVDEKFDKELPDVVGARGDTVKDRG